MVGNLWEWVSDQTQGNNPVWDPSADVSPPANTLVSDPGFADYGGDANFGWNRATNNLPGKQIFYSVIVRGGHHRDAEKAGVFASDACSSPSHFESSIGFRCGVPAH